MIKKKGVTKDYIAELAGKKADKKQEEVEKPKSVVKGISKLEELLNFRIQKEEEAYRLYKSMSFWTHIRGYEGTSKFLKKMACEELEHAQWAIDYLLDLDLEPKLHELKKPECGCESIKQIFEMVLEEEQEILKQVNELADYAMSEKDHMLYDLAMQYVKEQREEIAQAQTILSKIESFGQSTISLRLLDEELGKSL